MLHLLSLTPCWVAEVNLTTQATVAKTETNHYRKLSAISQAGGRRAYADVGNWLGSPAATSDHLAGFKYQVCPAVAGFKYQDLGGH